MILNAKVLIPNKSWIIENGKEKIATINKEKKGYSLTQQGKKFEAHDLTDIKERFGITIPNSVAENEKSAANASEIYGFAVKSRAFNPLWNVQRKLPIYSKSPKSKSLYCAGHYVIQFPKLWVKSFCPKLITLERYNYMGPFKTDAEAKALLNSITKGNA